MNFLLSIGVYYVIGKVMKKISFLRVLLNPRIAPY